MFFAQYKGDFLVVFNPTSGICFFLGFYNEQSIFVYVSLFSWIFKYFLGDDEANYIRE